MEAQNTAFKNIALLTRQRSLIYMMAMSYAEFVAQSASRDLLQMRQGEIRLAPDDQAFFAAYADTLHWLIMVSDDSPDTVAVLPVLMHVAACCPRIDMRLVLDDDEATAQVERLLDDRSVAAGLADADFPLVLIFDEEWQYQDQWGPHPQALEPYLDAWLAEHPDFEALSEDESSAAQVAYERLLDELAQTMRLWYNSELNQAAVTELRSLLSSLHESGDNDSDDNGDDNGDDDSEHADSDHHGG